MNIARSSSKLFLANITSTILSFIGITFFAREIGASQIGIFFLFKALLGMLAIPADFGLRGAVEKRISEGESPGAFLSSAIALKLAPITVIVLVILLLRPIINNYLGANLAVYLAIAIVIQEISQLSLAVLKGELRVGETAILNIVRQITWVGLGVVLVRFGLEVKAIIYSLIAGMAVVLVWGWYKSSISFERPTVTHAQSLFDYGKYDLINNTGGYIYGWADVIILGLFVSSAAVGAYEMAWRIAGIVILLSNTIAEAAFPQLSNWSANKQIKQIESFIPTIISASMIIVIPALFGGIVLSTDILGILYGSEYTVAAFAMGLLLAEKIFESVQNAVSSSLRAIDRPELLAKSSMAAQISNITLNFLLIPQLGLSGAAIATVSASIIGDALSYHYLTKYISVKFPTKNMFLIALSSILMASTIYILSVRIPLDTIPELIALIAVGILIYSGVLLSISSHLRSIFIYALQKHAYNG